MRLQYLVFPLLAISYLTACGPKQYDITVKLKPGQDVRYSMDVTSDAGVSSQITTVMKVIKIEGDRYLISSGMEKYVRNGSDIPVKNNMLGNMKATYYMDMRGKLFSAPSGNSQASSGAGSSTITFPDKPIKVGDTWSSSFDAGGDALRKGTYRLTGVDGSTAHVEIIDFTTGPLHKTGPSKVEVDLNSGLVTTMNLEMGGSLAGKVITTKMTLRRL